MRLSENTQHSVALIMAKTASGGNLTIAGLGFFVSIPFRSHPDKVFIYMVTSQQVLKIVEDFAIDDFVYLRVNTRTGKVGTARTPQDQWLSHPTDPAAGVAVLPWAPDRRQFEFSTISLDAFMDDRVPQHRQPGLGDPVWLAEMAVNPGDAMRNLPLVRGAQLAAQPQQLMGTEHNSKVHGHLLETRSNSGLVGGPVFAPLEQGKGIQEGLLGMTFGKWNLSLDNQPDRIFAFDNFSTMQMIASGLLLMIPAETIAEAIDHPDLKAAREERERRERRDKKDKVTPKKAPKES